MQEGQLPSPSERSQASKAASGAPQVMYVTFGFIVRAALMARHPSAEQNTRESPRAA